MSKLKLLDVDTIRRKFWDNKTHEGKPISYYSFQTFGGKDSKGNVPTSKGLKPDEVIPTGNLIHIHGNKKTTIYNWLCDNKMKPVGPYKSTGPAPKKDFYYLEFIATIEYGKKITPKLKYLQICSGPLNVISDDCLDEVHCWIK